jgi:DNA-binding PadR family transcriptional regulator
MKIKPLHYVLMAGIDAAPSSGYDLTLWLASLVRHFWAAEHSSIFPALQQLEAASFVTHREQLGKKGQPRKIYRLTTSGREKLRKWVDEPSADAQVCDEQMVKVLCFDLLSRDRMAKHLQRIRGRQAAKVFYYEDSLPRYLENRPKQVRLGPLLNLASRHPCRKSYVQWCYEALSLVARAKHRR